MPNSIIASVRRILVAITILAATMLPARASSAQTGACCVGTSCTIRTFSACNAAGGDPVGGSCSPNPCAVGRCCINGTCTIDTHANCTGTWSTGGSCSPNPCGAPTGACCINNACTSTTQAACSGVWSIGVACSANPCATVGACCDLTQSGGACHLTQQAACTETNTTIFAGGGTTCSPNPCVGACCNNATAACGIVTSVACASSGAFQGRLTVCSPDPCPAFAGACCDSSTGACHASLPSGCPFITGTSFFLGVGTTCTPARCLATCCTGNFACVLTPVLNCDTRGFAVAYGVSCTPTTCDRVGICCVSQDGTCFLTSSDNCPAPGGTFQFISSVCTPGRCVGPCCLGAACAVRTLDGCPGRELASFGATCSPDPCPGLVGACCQSSACSLAIEFAAGAGGGCHDAGGLFMGVGTTCSPNVCMGACCNAASGSCVVADSETCVQSFHAHYFGAAACTPNPCVALLGACCSGSTCQLSIDSFCTVQMNQHFVGIGTVCAPCNPCNQFDLIGACCRGTACTTEPQSCCSGAYQGVATTCGTSGNPTTCCPANFNGIGGLTVQDIFDFLNAWFAGSTSADFNHVGWLTVQDIFDFLTAWFAACS